MRFTNASFSLPTPDLVFASFRGSLEWLLGEGSTAHLSAVQMFSLAAAALEDGRNKETDALWNEAFPPLTVKWPQSWLDEEPCEDSGEGRLQQHKTLVRMLRDWAAKRGWSLFQASRERSGKIVPFAMFNVLKSRSSKACMTDHGSYVPTAEAAVLWCRILDCGKPFCGCSVTYYDRQALDSLRAAGVDARPVTDS